MGEGLGFLLDEDISHRVAEVSRGLGLDVRSVHEIGQRGWSDEDQLEAAARDGRILVTFNRTDFIHWTREFFRTRRPHAGILLVSRSLSRRRPEPIAHALARWAEGRGGESAPVPSYFIGFLSAGDA